MGNLVLQVMTDVHPSQPRSHFTVDDKVELYLTLYRDGGPVAPGKFDRGEVVGCLVGDTPDPDSIILTYVPWISPITRRIDCYFKKAANPIRLIATLGDGVETAEKHLWYSVFPKVEVQPKPGRRLSAFLNVRRKES